MKQFSKPTISNVVDSFPPGSGWLSAADITTFMISIYANEDIWWEFIEYIQIHYYVSVPKQTSILGINFLLTCTKIKHYTIEIWFLFPLTFLSSGSSNLYLSATNLHTSQVIRENQVLKSPICQCSSKRKIWLNLIFEKFQQMFPAPVKLFHMSWAFTPIAESFVILSVPCLNCLSVKITW